jgi:pseudoazurin
MIKTLAIAAALAVFPLACAFAAEHEVKMLNKGSDGQMMVFEPAYLEVALGDTITFLPTEPAHNAESIITMMPEEAETFRGPMNKAVSVTYTKEGIYGVKCLPHYGLGMVALFKVGEGAAPNLAAALAAKHPPRAAERFKTLFKDAGLDPALAQIASNR